MNCCIKKFNSEHKFQANFKLKPLTAKFYARHENNEVAPQILQQYQYFSKEIDRRIKYDSREHYYAPITTNQTYGWLERCGEKFTGLDREILVHTKPPTSL